MKKLLCILSFFVAALALQSSTEADGGNSLDARVNTYKAECRHMLRPFRYEGSRITYYSVQKEEIKRSVEAYLVLDTEYKFVFSAKEASTKVSIRIYDQSDEKKRILLKEVKSAQGQMLAISSNDLTKAYMKKSKSKERLKMVFIEYTIPGGNSKNEAIVMLVGFKDKD